MDSFPNIDHVDLQFRHPFTMIVSGSTGSGKSEWVMRLLHNLEKMISTPIERVIYGYGELNTNILNLQRTGKIGNVPVTVHSGVPSAEQVRDCAKKEKLLLILDDLVVGMSQQYLDALFTRGSHNWGVSVILVTQHLFNKELRVSRTNSHYLVLMRNPAGALQIRTIATHLFPSRTAYFMEAYRDACAKNFGYLLVDMHPEIIREASDEQILCMVEICLNILKGRVPLSPRHLKRLKTHAQVLRRLTRTRSSRSAKKVLLQHGDGLSAIVGLIASIALPLIADHTKRYLLVPEEIYQSLASPPPSDGTPIGLVRNRIKQIKNDDGINEAERAIKYAQELKRLNKLTRDEEERPVGVKLENVSDVVDAMPKPVNVKRPIVVATRRHLKVGRARKENVEQLEDEDDDDNDETPKPSSSNKRQPTQTEILKLIYKNAQSLGVSEEGQVLRAGGRPFITSSVYDIVSHLLNKDKRAQNKEPTAFKEFVERAKQNPQLTTQRTYTLHRQAKRRYRRLPTLAPGLHTEWQADLAIFDRLGKQNRGYKYLLVCIDTLSRQVFVEPVKTKTSANMINAFEHIFKRSKYIPWKVLTDQGKEFTARAVQQFFRTKDVEHFCMLTSPQFHAGMAERANRSIKERLYRYFTEQNTYKWIDVVQDIVCAINHSQNSSIGMRPVDVNFKNAEALRQKLHDAAENVVRRQPKYRVGDRVRIEKYKHVFQKGYLPRFSNELFTVAEVHSERSPVVYRLRDDNNEIISGTVEQQFVQIEWQTGNTVRIELPSSNVTNPHELGKNLYRLLDAGTLVDLNTVAQGLLAREKRAETSNILLRMPDDDNDSYQQKLDEYFSKLSQKNLSIIDELGMIKLNAEIKNLTEEERVILEATKEMGTEAWIQAYREIRLVCQFNYDINRNRFILNTDPRYVKKVVISPQLAYILGFNSTEFIHPKNEASFMPDMSGGVSSFHVYTPDLIEPMMIGDVTAPVLRIVTIRGNPDQIVEEQFFAIQYHKILLKEVSEIQIEIRTNSGSLMPFQYGTLDWSTFSSEGVQFGGYNIYRGLPYQRGAGVGALFRSLMRYLLPIGKQIGSAIGRQGMESGNRVLTKVLEGKDLKESLWSEHFLSSTNQRVCCSFILSSSASASNNHTRITVPVFDCNSDNLWTDLSRIYLYLELSIEKPGANDKWVAIEDTDTNVSAIQGIGQTFVQQLKVTAKDVFLLQTLKANDGTKYRLTVHDVKIYAKMVEVQPSLNMSLYKTLEKQPATYAVRKTEIKSSFISVGRYEFEYNVFSATIPRRVIIALVGNSAFHGDYKLSPFMFEPFDLREISVHAGGIVYPAVPYKLNFSNDHFVSAFVDMYEALGMANSERSFDISMAQFKKGWTFFVIPLTSTLDDSCGFELLRSGTTNVRATFNSPIPLGGVEMICLG
ncbi:hypothetical protein niasHT_036145 [Heterodera trifolii]|uniref:Integrase catalytic domain-containing protein n=1 Tax=Heterodera trifolii TaxID=157864 RepID=A0ABD2J6Z7_9BILA